MAKFPHSREHSAGRSILGDFMDDDLNESIYDQLIEASNAIQRVLDILRDHRDTQSMFDIGGLSAAQHIIDSHIDEDYPPLKTVWDDRLESRLKWAVSDTAKT